MKAILVLLLLIGVVSAVPLKNPKYNVKNLQNLLTQHFNTLLQNIQQNQDLYQEITTTHQTEYQLLAQWFILPRLGLSDIQSLFADTYIQAFFESIGFQSFLDNFDIEQFLESLGIQSLLANSIVEQFLGDIENETVLDAIIDVAQLLGSYIIQSVQSLIEPILTPQFLSDFLNFAFQHPAEFEIIRNFFESFATCISFDQGLDQYIDGTFLQQLSNPVVEFLAFLWTVSHLNGIQHLAIFFSDYLPFGQTIESLINRISTTLADFLSNLLTNLLTKFQQFYGSFTIQSLLSNSYIEEQHGNIIFGSVNIALNYLVELLGSFNTETILGFIDFEQLLGNFIIQPFLQPQIIPELMLFSTNHPNETENIISFLSSVGIEYPVIFGQILAGTYDPQQYLNPELAVQALGWVYTYPSEFVNVDDFLISYLTIDLVIELINPVNTVLPDILKIFVTHYLTNIFPSLA